MSKKCWPNLYRKLLYKLGQDFLDIQYTIFFYLTQISSKLHNRLLSNLGYQLSSSNLFSKLACLLERNTCSKRTFYAQDVRISNSKCVDLFWVMKKKSYYAFGTIGALFHVLQSWVISKIVIIGFDKCLRYWFFLWKYFRQNCW